MSSSLSSTSTWKGYCFKAIHSREGPDTEAMQQVTDAIKDSYSKCFYFVELMTESLTNSDLTGQYNTLMLLDFTMKNCGKFMWQCVHSGLMHRLKQLVYKRWCHRSKGSHSVLKYHIGERAALMVLHWGHFFSDPSRNGNYPIFFQTYVRLLDKFVTFPPFDGTEMIKPAKTHKSGGKSSSKISSDHHALKNMDEVKSLCKVMEDLLADDAAATTDFMNELLARLCSHHEVILGNIQDCYDDEKAMQVLTELSERIETIRYRMAKLNSGEDLSTSPVPKRKPKRSNTIVFADYNSFEVTNGSPYTGINTQQAKPKKKKKDSNRQRASSTSDQSSNVQSQNSPRGPVKHNTGNFQESITSMFNFAEVQPTVNTNPFVEDAPHESSSSPTLSQVPFQHAHNVPVMDQTNLWQRQQFNSCEALKVPHASSRQALPGLTSQCAQQQAQATPMVVQPLPITSASLNPFL